MGAMYHDGATLRRRAREWIGALLLLSAGSLVAAPAPEPVPASAAFTARAGTLQEPVMLSRGDGGMPGMALFRPVLQGVLYRAGFKGGDRTHTGLGTAQREALCAAGFSAARYVDFGSQTRFGATQCPAGTFDYAKGSTANPGEILRQVHEVIEDPSRGPVLLHCMWGVHSSGAIAAMALVQFCGWSEERAKAYWHAARNNAPCSGGCDAWIDAHFRHFAVDSTLVPTPQQQAAICPAGVVSGAVAPPTPALAGTAWELLSVQSMDDATGTTTVEDPARYTLHFGSDGTAAFRLDCNRAHGTWQSQPAADGVSGSINFGPLAGTRALCPPPSLDERVMRDMAYVRGYLLRDGRLHLSLEADGGIYSWRPAP